MNLNKIAFLQKINLAPPVSAVSNSALTVGHYYDIMDRVTNTVYRDGAGAAVRSFAYAYDPAGLLTQKVTVADGTAVTNAYAYDGLGRLVSADGVTYAYDLSGNRLSQSDTGVPPVQSTYTHNRLGGDLYDAAGCVTNMTRNGVTLSLAWNTLGQLVSVATNGAFAESYAYDALGRRISTTSLSTINHEPSTIYHWYDGAQCVADTDASGNLLRSYAWGPGIDDLLAVTVCSSGATNSYFVIKDRLGSVHALVNAQGQVVESYSYDAWGNAQSAVGNGRSAIGNRFLFQGREYSAATGLYNFRARWYDPASGRWLSKDPIGLEGGLNLYAFCGDDPVNFRDPFGQDVQLNLLPRSQKVYSNAQNYFPVDDLIFTVAVHGNSDGSGITGANGRTIAVEDLAQMIRHSPGYYPGEEVKLISCFTGLGFANLLAQALSRLTGEPTTVTGPTGPAWISSAGEVNAAYNNRSDGRGGLGAPAVWNSFTGSP